MFSLRFQIKNCVTTPRGKTSQEEVFPLGFLDSRFHRNDKKKQKAFEFGLKKGKMFFMETVEQTPIEKIVEAILFWKNEPVSIEKLASMAKTDVPTTELAIKNIEAKLDSGIVLMRNGDKVALRTSPEASEIIEKLQKEELSKELSKAALETLTIVLYKSPVRRSTVDYIRGVNSQFIIRHLEARGLVEKIDDPKDQRVNLYKPTFELLSYLGIKSELELPEFDALREKVEVFVEQELKENDEVL